MKKVKMKQVKLGKKLKKQQIDDIASRMKACPLLRHLLSTPRMQKKKLR